MVKNIIYYDKYFNNWCVTAEINYLRGLRSHRTHCVNGEKMNFDTPEEFRDFLISKGYGGVYRHKKQVKQQLTCFLL